jgi:hypothetical protein
MDRRIGSGPANRKLLMLWNSLRWNLGNTLAVGAFCLLPLVGLIGSGASDQTPAQDTPVALSVVSGHRLAACPQHEHHAEVHGLGRFDRA